MNKSSHDFDVALVAVKFIAYVALLLFIVVIIVGLMTKIASGNEVNITDESKAYITCLRGSGGDTGTITECVYEETDRLEVFINESLEKIIKTANTGPIKGKLHNLGAAVEGWATHRKNMCEVIFNNPDYGFMMNIVVAECHMRYARALAIDIDNILVMID